MKMSFKLGRKGTLIICLATLISLLVAFLCTNEVTIVISAVSLFAFWTCSQSKAFDATDNIAWLVAITSLVTAVVIIVFKLMLTLLKWLVSLITKTPPAKMPHFFK